jgi:hypothetical protein
MVMHSLDPLAQLFPVDRPGLGPVAIQVIPSPGSATRNAFISSHRLARGAQEILSTSAVGEVNEGETRKNAQYSARNLLPVVACVRLRVRSLGLQ